MVDEWRNIAASDRAPVFRSHLDGGRVRDDALAPVGRHLVVYTELERLEKGRFAVEAAALHTVRAEGAQ